MFGLQRKGRLAVAAAALAVGVSLALAGCSGGSGDSGDQRRRGWRRREPVDHDAARRTSATPYFDTSTKGATEAADEFGGTLEEVGPSEASPTSQVQYIQTAAQQGAGALIVSANDPEALCDALGEASDAGVKVVTFDSDTNPECRDLFINQASAEGIAKVQVDLIAEQIGDAGQIAILSASANATNQNAWIETMKEMLAADHPDIELVEVVYGDDDDQTSFDKTAALLQTYPELKGIVSPTTVGIAAAARYLSTSEYKGKVALTGLGTPNQMREYVEDGTVTRSPCGTRKTSATSPRSPRRRSSPATSPVKRATHSRPASSATTRSAPTASCCSATRTSSTQENIGDFNFMSRIDGNARSASCGPGVSLLRMPRPRLSQDGTLDAPASVRGVGGRPQPRVSAAARPQCVGGERGRGVGIPHPQRNRAGRDARLLDGGTEPASSSPTSQPSSRPPSARAP